MTLVSRHGYQGSWRRSEGCKWTKKPKLPKGSRDFGASVSPSHITEDSYCREASFPHKGYASEQPRFWGLSVLQQEYLLMVPYAVFSRFYDLSQWCNFSCGVRLWKSTTQIKLGATQRPSAWCPAIMIRVCAGEHLLWMRNQLWILTSVLSLLGAKNVEALHHRAVVALLPHVPKVFERAVRKI